MNFTYLTATNNKYPLSIFLKKIQVRDFSYEPEMVRNLCAIGCSNFGKAGGCPPRAPLLSSLFTQDQYVWLIAIRFDSIYKPDKVKSSRNIAIHWKFQDAILARVLNNLGHKLVETFSGGFLATGYCMGCPGKKCSFKLGEEKCRNPLKRTFSLEATGINVVKTVKNNLGFDLHWYTKGNTNIPYMIKCIAYFPNETGICSEDIYKVLDDFPKVTKM